MTPAVRERIFEPFFTTKPQGQGTGLGLATVYGVVQQSGGRIQVESAPGRGTSFHLWFPLATGAPQPAAPAETGLLRGGTETLLLVEDEPQVRRFAARVLRARGYQVLEASDGVAGLEVALQRPAPIDLLISDLVMPRMGGLELSRKLCVHWPGLAVLLVSGYSETALPAAEGAALLTKPFRADELARRVRQALDEARGLRASG
jgi:CheY-like chemotaxis protein